MGFSELMMQGLQLLLLGMGIVFSFLIVLVFTMKGMIIVYRCAVTWRPCFTLRRASYSFSCPLIGPGKP